MLRRVIAPRSPTSGLSPNGGRRTTTASSMAPDVTVGDPGARTSVSTYADANVRNRSAGGRPMNADDLILVSVDDHVVEPPHLFEGRLSATAAERAPYVTRLDDGRDVWMFEGNAMPNVGLNAVSGRVQEEWGLDALSFDQMRPGCYDIHERIRDMDVNGVLGSLNFPSLTGFAGQLFSTCPDKAHRPRAAAGLQRLAHRRVVRHLPGPHDPARHPADLGPAADGRRGAPHGRQGLSRRDLLGEPREARPARASTPTTGTRSGRPAATPTRSCACTSARRRRWSPPPPTRRSTR